MQEPETSGAGTAHGRLWVFLGGSLALLLALGVCLARWKREVDSEARFRRRVDTLARNLVQTHWVSMRQAVSQIVTDEGAKALFAASPGLSPRIPSEDAFLAKARTWRALVRPLPEALPGLESRDLSYLKVKDQVEMRYRLPNGTCIFMKWTQDRLVDMRIY